MPYKRPHAVNVKVIPIKHLPGVFASMQPTLGAIYDAEYIKSESLYKIKDFCVIKVNGKKVVMRSGEFEIIGGITNG